MYNRNILDECVLKLQKHRGCPTKKRFESSFNITHPKIIRFGNSTNHMPIAPSFCWYQYYLTETSGLFSIYIWTNWRTINHEKKKKRKIKEKISMMFGGVVGPNIYPPALGSPHATPQGDPNS